jgi:hypothetical protein
MSKRSTYVSISLSLYCCYTLLTPPPPPPPPPPYPLFCVPLPPPAFLFSSPSFPPLSPHTPPPSPPTPPPPPSPPPPPHPPPPLAHFFRSRTRFTARRSLSFLSLTEARLAQHPSASILFALFSPLSRHTALIRISSPQLLSLQPFLSVCLFLHALCVCVCVALFLNSRATPSLLSPLDCTAGGLSTSPSSPAPPPPITAHQRHSLCPRTTPSSLSNLTGPLRGPPPPRHSQVFARPRASAFASAGTLRPTSARVSATRTPGV